MLTTQDPARAERARILSGHGILKRTGQPTWWREASETGHNFRMPDLLAAIALVQLEKLDRMNEKRRRCAQILTERLSHIPGVVTPIEISRRHHVFQMYTLRLTKGRPARDAIVEALNADGIQASVHFCPPVHLQKPYQRAARTNLEVTERVSASILSLPMYPDLTDDEIDRIADRFRFWALRT